MKLVDWWIGLVVWWLGGLVVAGLVSRVERVEDWKITNHPITQSSNGVSPTEGDRRTAR